MFQHLDISIFEKNIGKVLIGEDGESFWQKVEKIVSLRDIKTILDVRAMPIIYLKQLIRNVRLEGNLDCKPYENCEIQLIRIDPHSLKIGQTFVERRKYQSLLENFSNFFNGYCITRGAAKCNAYIVQGYTADMIRVVAHYVPPIIEENNGDLVLLDGVHRCFLIKNVGTTSEAIKIRKVEAIFPCETQEWSAVRIVDSKPPRHERYLNLDTKFFRDLKMVGIDG